MEKIRVVFVHHRLVCGGAEQALFDLVSLMDKTKFDVSVFIQHDDGAWDQKFRDAGIKVVYDYSCRKPTLNPITKAGNIIKRFRTQEAYKRNGKGLLDVCFPGGINIVVSYSVWENEQMVFAQNAKTVKYIHGDVATNQIYRDDALSSINMLSKFEKIVCVSQTACESFCSYTGLHQNVEAHYNPLNSQNVKTLAENNVDLPLDAPLICAVGRLSPEKGFERLIVIHKRLLEQGVFHRLVIVGDGEDRQFLKRLVKATGTEETVILAGYQINPYPYMKNSRFLVNSSFTEGLPVIAMEALCLGVPIITPIPAVAEIFGQENCGLITENDNASLEAGIKRMLVDEEFYQQVKAGAVKRSAFFDGKRMVTEVEDMFVKLVSEVKE